jgi:hypothetical protein
MAGELSQFQVPSYLEPPSQGEQAQLGMEQSRMEAQQAEMLQRGFERMQKKVTMARVMGEAQVWQAAGADPEEARSLALLKNGKGLFDTPEEWNRVSTELEDSIARKRATKAFHEEIQHGLAQPDENGNLPDPQDVLRDAWMKWGPEISGKAGFQPFINTQTRAAVSRERIATQATTADLAREAANKRAAETEKGRNVRAEAVLAARAETAIAKDPLLKDLTEQHQTALHDVRRYSHEETTWTPGWAGGRNKKMIQADADKAKQEVADLERQIKAREDQLRSKFKSTQTAPADNAADETTTPDETAAPDETTSQAPDPAGIRSLLAP